MPFGPWTVLTRFSFPNKWNSTKILPIPKLIFTMNPNEERTKSLNLKKTWSNKRRKKIRTWIFRNYVENWTSDRMFNISTCWIRRRTSSLRLRSRRDSLKLCPSFEENSLRTWVWDMLPRFASTVTTLWKSLISSVSKRVSICRKQIKNHSQWVWAVCPMNPWICCRK
jgi:hypothetical protein